MPRPVITQTTVSLRAASPASRSFFKPAIVEAAAGSAKMPSAFARRLVASSISSVETTAPLPLDSLIDWIARAPCSGFVMARSGAMVSALRAGSGTLAPLRNASTMGAHPETCTPVIDVLASSINPVCCSSLIPFQIMERWVPLPIGTMIRSGDSQSSCSKVS